MIRPTLALMNRSLRLDMRLRRFHVLRLLVVGLLFLFLIWVQFESILFGAPGLMFFETIIWLNFVLITLAGASFFATAITEEKEELTLELFTIAGISPVSILLGKSTNRFLAALLVLVAQLPFTLLAITLGGTTFGQIAAAYVGLTAYLFLVANIALFFSVICSRSGSAMFSSAFTILLALFGTSTILGTLNNLVTHGFLPAKGTVVQYTSLILDKIDAASLLSRIPVIVKTGFKEPPVSFQVTSNLAAGSAFFILSWMVFRLFNRGASRSAPSRSWLPQSNRHLRLLGPLRPWSDALVWKDFYFIAGGKLMILGRFLLVPLLVAALAFLQYIDGWRINWWDKTVGNIVVVSLAVLAGELAIQASRIFHDEVKWKTLSNIAMLPRSITSTAYAKVRGCLLGCVPYIVWLGLGIAAESQELLDRLDSVSDLILMIAVVVHFILFLHVVAFVSLYIKWGALPMATVVFLAYSLTCTSCLSVMLMGLLMSSRDDTGLFALMGYASFFAGVPTVMLHYAIGERLRTLKGAA